MRELQNHHSAATTVIIVNNYSIDGIKCIHLHNKIVYNCYEKSTCFIYSYFKYKYAYYKIKSEYYKMYRK